MLISEFYGAFMAFVSGAVDAPPPIFHAYLLGSESRGVGDEDKREVALTKTAAAAAVAPRHQYAQFKRLWSSGFERGKSAHAEAGNGTLD